MIMTANATIDVHAPKVDLIEVYYVKVKPVVWFHFNA